jgi:hypothetical protein
MTITKYYVKNQSTLKFLASDGGWGGSIGDEKTLSWDSEQAAMASIPNGESCYILKVVKESKPTVKPARDSGPSSNRG